MGKSQKTIFICQNCNYQALKWMGKCPDCGEWDCFVEHQLESRSQLHTENEEIRNAPVLLHSVEMSFDQRICSQIKEFDRVLGGGLVPGSIILIGGDPGIGKSTLMLQIFHGFSKQQLKVLYVSGEESVHQIKLRSDRLGLSSDHFWIVSETNIEAIQKVIHSVSPDVLVIDSIQTMYSHELQSAPGTVSQVREAAMKFMLIAKKSGMPVFLIGHVTKEGIIAGPKLLEHMVDTVLYFEGDRNHIFRILRSVKNRYGSTNEIGVFEMRGKGLAEVANPSSVFLSERPLNVPGSVVTASMEGTRPILIELQALASRTFFGNPRRTILGLDPNRVALLVAVLEKKAGLQLIQHDIFMNVAGGFRVDEPALDMGIIAAIASSFLDQPIPSQTAVFGEIGLTGEVRAISHIETRISETKKMGFSQCLIPYSNLNRLSESLSKGLIGIKTVAQAIHILFKNCNRHHQHSDNT